MPNPNGLIVADHWYHNDADGQDYLSLFVDGMRYTEPDIQPDETTTENWIAFTPEEVEYLVLALGSMLNEFKTQ